MKVQLQYLNDQDGNLKEVQIPIEEWKKLEKRMEKYEQAFQLKEDLTAAFRSEADERRKITQTDPIRFLE